MIECHERAVHGLRQRISDGDGAKYAKDNGVPGTTARVNPAQGIQHRRRWYPSGCSAHLNRNDRVNAPGG